MFLRRRHLQLQRPGPFLSSPRKYQEQRVEHLHADVVVQRLQASAQKDLPFPTVMAVLPTGVPPAMTPPAAALPAGIVPATTLLSLIPSPHSPFCPPSWHLMELVSGGSLYRPPPLLSGDGIVVGPQKKYMGYTAYPLPPKEKKKLN